MNIGVYVSSQYGDYYEFSKLLASAIRKCTKDPVLLGVYSNSKDTGYELLRRYAEDRRIRLKTYTSEWNRKDDPRFTGKRGQSLGGVIAIYHCVHNSERTIAFNSGGKGTAAFIKMSERLDRPCDVIQVNPFKKTRYMRRMEKDAEMDKADAAAKKPEKPKIQRNIPAKTQDANSPVEKTPVLPSATTQNAPQRTGSAVPQTVPTTPTGAAAGATQQRPIQKEVQGLSQSQATPAQTGRSDVSGAPTNTTTAQTSHMAQPRPPSAQTPQTPVKSANQPPTPSTASATTAPRPFPSAQHVQTSDGKEQDDGKTNAAVSPAR